MISDDEIRRIVLKRLQAVDGTCNQTLLAHTDGVMRGLLWALTGEDHGTELTRDVLALLKIAGVPAKLSADKQKVDWEFDV